MMPGIGQNAATPGPGARLREGKALKRLGAAQRPKPRTARASFKARQARSKLRLVRSNDQVSPLSAVRVNIRTRDTKPCDGQRCQVAKVRQDRTPDRMAPIP